MQTFSQLIFLSHTNACTTHEKDIHGKPMSVSGRRRWLCEFNTTASNTFPTTLLVASAKNCGHRLCRFTLMSLGLRAFDFARLGVWLVRARRSVWRSTLALAWRSIFSRSTLAWRSTLVCAHSALAWCSSRARVRLLALGFGLC